MRNREPNSRTDNSNTQELPASRSGRSGAVSSSAFLQDVVKNFPRYKYLYLMTLVGVAYFFLFNYLPMYGILLAFKDYSPISGILRSQWVGLKYFTMFFENPFLVRLIRNTVLLGLLTTFWTFWPPILLALLFNELRSSAYKRVVQTITYFPNFIATVIIVGLLKDFFSVYGLVYQIKDIFGSPQAIAYFSKPEWFRPLYIGSELWQRLGAGTIIYLATIAGINPELYESAIIDGANRLKRVFYITLPSMLPTIMIILIFNTTAIVNVGFEKVYLMYSPAVYDTADVIATYTYRLGIQGGMFSYGSAVGLINQAAALIFMVGANYLSRRTTGQSVW